MRLSTKLAVATFLIHVVAVVSIVAGAYRSNSGLEQWGACLMIGFLDFPLIPVISWIGDAPWLDSDTQFILILLVSVFFGGGLYGGAVCVVAHLLLERGRTHEKPKNIDA
jgi:hypothetical protein